MSDKPKHATHEQLINGDVYTTCILNEPIVDFVIDFAVEPPLTAREIADRRWHMTKQ